MPPCLNILLLLVLPIYLSPCAGSSQLFHCRKRREGFSLATKLGSGENHAHTQAMGNGTVIKRGTGVRESEIAV